MNDSSSNFSISNSNFHILSNSPSHVLETEKNISFSFPNSDYLNLSNFKSTMSEEEKLYNLLKDIKDIDNENIDIFNEKSIVKCNEIA